MHPMVQKPYMGILLDMAGSRGARFPREGLSMRHAPGVVNVIALSATFDIINLPTYPGANRTFGLYWHTLQDNMDIISKPTLGAVGDVLLQVLYKNAAGVL